MVSREHLLKACSQVSLEELQQMAAPEIAGSVAYLDVAGI